MKQARLENMPEQLKVAYNEVAAEPSGLQAMHDKDAKRMVDFKDIPDEKIKSIKAPTLIIIGDKDVITPEHAIEMHRLMANSEFYLSFAASFGRKSEALSLFLGKGNLLSHLSFTHPKSPVGDFALSMNSVGKSEHCEQGVNQKTPDKKYDIFSFL